MTTHEYIAPLDLVAFTHSFFGMPQPDCVVIDDRYHEDIALMDAQIQNDAEMKASYDATLRQEGAVKALIRLAKKLKDIEQEDLSKGVYQSGIVTALYEIGNALNGIVSGLDLIEMPVAAKGGAA
jgi:hypothetical protein